MVRYPSSTSSESESPPWTPDAPKSSNGKLGDVTFDRGSDNALFKDLRDLHNKELKDIWRRKGTLGDRWRFRWLRYLEIVIQYVEYVVETWIKCAWSIVFLPPSLADWLSAITMSFLACAIITLILPWCLFCSNPIVEFIAHYVLEKQFGGLSLVNFVYPWIFDLNEDHAIAGREHLSKPPERADFSNPETLELLPREFNLDAAKILLQCAALMYERSGVSKRDKKEGEDSIKELAKSKLGLEYCIASECNTLETPFCALFWDPSKYFIIVAFKGTSPTDFMEWRTDFNFNMTPANRWLNGFGRVHEGFMDKIFPKQTKSGIMMPYDTIVKAIRRVSTGLLKNVGNDNKINVWITGHSLGCALASVTYSRMVNEPRELGPNICVRDAYIFAAPIVCDVQSAGAFDNRMNHFSDEFDYQKTMWRVTNKRDAVATLLPEGGDNLRWSFSPWNLFAFSHLGSEIKMRRKQSIVAGNHITPGTNVTIVSACKPAEPEGKEEVWVRTILDVLQMLPIVGTLVAHAPGCYWASLMEMETGECKWE